MQILCFGGGVLNTRLTTEPEQKARENMEKFCDLHAHSTYSDGTLSPAELIALAEREGLGALALTDHNTVSGLPAFLEAAANSAVQVVPGVEFSTDYGEKEVHILALFVKPEHYAAVTETVRPMLERKEQSNLDLVAGLKTAGILLDYEKIKATTPDGQVNRAIIAAELVRLGYCGSVKEAFKSVLSEKHGFFHPPKRLDALDTIAFIKSIGAVAVLAHPFLNLSEEELRRFLPQAVERGLDAMEVYYSDFSSEQVEQLSRMAEEFDLLPSGGSDFHGANKPRIRLGTGMDNLRIPCSVKEKLAQRVGKYVEK